MIPCEIYSSKVPQSIIREHLIDQGFQTLHHQAQELVRQNRTTEEITLSLGDIGGDIAGKRILEDPMPLYRYIFLNHHGKKQKAVGTHPKP